MLQDMGHARIIRRRGAKADIKDLVVVLVGEQADLCSGLSVLQIVTGGVKLSYLSFLY